MYISLPNFKKGLEKLGAKLIIDTTCPRKQDMVCMNVYNNCSKGLNDDCSQRLLFTIGASHFDIEVFFYGPEKKGQIDTETTSIKNLVLRTKQDIDTILKA